ncbi:MAG TPA: glycosyltransferase family 4 protein [Flavipsychrobacter sp.]|nr:glycosyltransferase family 4 protein [Flavipsychrobacter sp.]
MELSILYVVGDLTNGGQERQLYYLSTALNRKGYKVTVVVWSFNEKAKYAALLENEGIELIQYKEGSSYQKIAKTRNLIRERKFDIVHSFTFYLNFYVFLSTLFTKSIGIGGIRNRLKMYKKSTPRPLFAFCSMLPARIISNNYKYNEGYKINPFWRKVFVIPNGLDVNKFTHEQSAGNEVIQTVSLARLYPEKRIDWVIDAISELVKKGYKVHHRHAGAGPQQQELLKKVDALNLKDHFVFTGEVTDVNAFIASGDFFILTSYHEGCPNVVMEAMASGRPVVSTDCGDVSYLIDNGNDSIIVPVDNFEDLVTGMEKLINDKSLRVAMGTKARASAEKKFSIEKYAQQNIDYYNSIL